MYVEGAIYGGAHRNKVYDTQIRLCDNATLMRYLNVQAQKSIEIFKDKCLPCNVDYRFALLRIEAFFICSACDMLNIDNLIEIDTLKVNNGLSTELFSKYFNGEKTKIYSIGLNVNSKIQDRITGSGKINNVNLSFPKGDKSSFAIANELIEKTDGYTGVFIDSNNGNHVYRFMDTIFCNENVIFCAIHDEGNRKAQLPQKYKDFALYSGNNEFVTKYSFLDKNLYNVLKDKRRGNRRFALVDIMNKTNNKGFEVCLVLNPKYKRR